MSLILTGLFVLGGGILGAALVRFWDGIKNWLNNVAADAVERTLGYKARQNIHKAVSIVDRIFDKIKNTSYIYSKQSPTATYFDKTTITASGRVENLEADVLRELSKNNNRIAQTFEYAR